MSETVSDQVGDGLAFDWDWVPLERLGPVSFGTPISDYTQMLGLELEHYEEVAGYKESHFKVNGVDIDIYIQDGLVDTIISREVFMYHGNNVIESTMAELSEILGREPDEKDEIDLSDDDEAEPYEILDYLDLGIQVWLLNGKVESISCSHNTQTEVEPETEDEA